MASRRRMRGNGPTHSMLAADLDRSLTVGWTRFSMGQSCPRMTVKTQVSHLPVAIFGAEKRATPGKCTVEGQDFIVRNSRQQSTKADITTDVRPRKISFAFALAIPVAAVSHCVVLDYKISIWNTVGRRREVLRCVQWSLVLGHRILSSMCYPILKLWQIGVVDILYILSYST